MKKFYTTMFTQRELRRTLASFSALEIALFFVLVLGLVSSTALLARDVHRSFTVPEPAHRGTFSEGMIGTPRLINPILAESQIDTDMSRLLYAGLMRRGIDGSTIPELAEEYTVDDTGTTYRFTLKKDVHFHDGAPVTTKDIAYTIKTLQDPLFRSPLRIQWEGVKVLIVDERTIEFTLEAPYSGFLENATLGILPEHIWKSSTYDQFVFEQHNLRPIGAGPYRFESIALNEEGIPTEIKLRVFEDYVLQQPFIARRNFKFSKDENELVYWYNDGSIDALSGISPQQLSRIQGEKHNVYSLPLPRVFGIFFNPEKQPLFRSKEITEALDLVIDRKLLVEELFDGHATPITTPFPGDFLGNPRVSSSDILEDRINQAAKILDDGGWIYDKEEGVRIKKTKNGSSPLILSLTTSNTGDMMRVASYLQGVLSRIHVQLNLVVVDSNDLLQDTIRKREFEALLFGYEFSHDTNIFAYWHSSQRNDPGLNITGYTNTKADKLLEKALEEPLLSERKKIYSTFTDIISEEHPALFLFTPHLIYVTKYSLKGEQFEILQNSADRFNQVFDHYLYVYRTLRFLPDAHRQ